MYRIACELVRTCLSDRGRCSRRSAQGVRLNFAMAVGWSVEEPKIKSKLSVCSVLSVLTVIFQCCALGFNTNRQHSCDLHSSWHAAAEGSPVKMLHVIIGLLKSGGAGGQPEPLTLMITISIHPPPSLPTLPSILQPPSSPQTAEWRRQSCWESHSHTLYNQLCAAVMVLKL